MYRYWVTYKTRYGLRDAYVWANSAHDAYGKATRDLIVDAECVSVIETYDVEFYLKRRAS